jgi:hypothetical protein
MARASANRAKICGVRLADGFWRLLIYGNGYPIAVVRIFNVEALLQLAGRPSLVICHWSLVIGHLSFVICHW